MRVIAMFTLVVVIMTFSLCHADALVQEAYTLYNQGRQQEAVRMLEEYVKDNPDPSALYLLGYVYYQKGEMEKARRYFEDAYLIDPEFSPVKR